MATLLEQYHARRSDSTLRQKCEAAVILAALAVRSEDAGTANHATRLTWANLVVTDTSKLAAATDMAVIACIANATIGANPPAATDNDIKFVVNGSVDFMAGVSGATTPT